jgi:tetraacyldisaccharide 4'-kinase
MFGDRFYFKLALHRFVNEIWYGRNFWQYLLVPFACFYGAVVRARKMAYESGVLNVFRARVPVLVVGNVSVGGTGKTPLTIWLASKLTDFGFKPGIVCGGYHGRAKSWPQQVRADSDNYVVGDEAIILAANTSVPVVAGPDRGQSVKALLEKHDVDIVLCDDGMQHYALARDIEIAVINGVRRLGNGKLLPAGPLRESGKRLAEVDMIVCNGIPARGEFAMKYKADELRKVGDTELTFPVKEFGEKHIHAVAGIGNPESFFSLLESLGFLLDRHVFPDHHSFEEEDIEFGDNKPILMTEKDAVKCTRLKNENMWYLPLNIELSSAFEDRLKSILKGLLSG